MITKLVKYLVHPVTAKAARQIGRVWVLAFVAASGGIWARRLHREPPIGSKPQPGQRQRPWNGPTHRR